MNESEKNRLLEMDLYKLLDVEETSTAEQIKKAYRKKALELHPDKNLGNKEEAETKFIELGKAFEILADKSAKAAYDAVRKQKREKAARDQQLDDKRRKLKEDLERREKEAKGRFEQKTQQLIRTKEEENLKKEIDRLREEGSRILAEEMEKINEQIRLDRKRASEAASAKNEPVESTKPPRFKVKMDSKLDEDRLTSIFSQYGPLECMVIGKKKTAVLEFQKLGDALKCLKDQDTIKNEHSVDLEWLGPELNSDSVKEKKILDPNMSEELRQFKSASLEDQEALLLKKIREMKSKQSQ